MKNRTALKAFILFALTVTMGVWILSLRKDLIEYFEPRQELLERGEAVQARARIFHKEGLLNVGVRYIEIVYEKDGEEHTGEARMAQNFRKLPGEETGNGWTFVTCDGAPSAHYENTILITDGAPEVLSLTPEEKILYNVR